MFLLIFFVFCVDGNSLAGFVEDLVAEPNIIITEEMINTESNFPSLGAGSTNNVTINTTNNTTTTTTQTKSVWGKPKDWSTITKNINNDSTSSSSPSTIINNDNSNLNLQNDNINIKTIQNNDDQQNQSNDEDSQIFDHEIQELMKNCIPFGGFSVEEIRSTIKNGFPKTVKINFVKNTRFICPEEPVTSQVEATGFIFTPNSEQQQLNPQKVGNTNVAINSNNNININNKKNIETHHNPSPHSLYSPPPVHTMMPPPMYPYYGYPSQFQYGPNGELYVIPMGYWYPPHNS